MIINSQQRVFGLDLMRAIAITLVIVSHGGWIYGFDNGLISDLLAFSGFFGVEIFFVLSGFLIGGIIYKLFLATSYNKLDLWNFWIRRWFRTFPNYYLILIINIIMFILMRYELPDSLWTYFFFFQNFTSEMPYFFTESWSLPIEEFAYIIGPMLLFFLMTITNKINRNQSYLVITIFVLSVFLVSKIIYSNNNLDTDMIEWNSNLKAVVIYRIDSIYYGFLFFWLYRNYNALIKKNKILISMVGFSLIAITILWIPLTGWTIENKPSFWNIFYLPIVSVSIGLTIPLLMELEFENPFKKVITYISVISYSIYLVHYSIVLQLMFYFFDFETLQNNIKVIVLVLYFSATIGISALLYKYFEKPLMDLRDNPKVKRYLGL